MSVDQGPVVMIGLQQIYDAVIRLDGTVARLVDQNHDFAKDNADHESRIRVIELTGLTEKLPDHGRRISALEAMRWPLPTVTALIALTALIVSIVMR